MHSWEFFLLLNCWWCPPLFSTSRPSWIIHVMLFSISHFFSVFSFFLSCSLPPSVLQNDANCDCYQTGDGYAKDARLNCPSSLVVSPDGTLYVADLGNIRIRAIRRNQPPTGMNNNTHTYMWTHFPISLCFWEAQSITNKEIIISRSISP